MLSFGWFHAVRYAGHRRSILQTECPIPTPRVEDQILAFKCTTHHRTFFQRQAPEQIRASDVRFVFIIRE